MTHRYIEILHSRLCDAAAVYIQPGADREAYLDGLAATIREHSCEPFQVSAEVTAPGSPTRISERFSPVGVSLTTPVIGSSISPKGIATVVFGGRT
ncbi:hypothetical protein [Luteibacter sp. 329MFSha]|uniref:hypothetical protein n=1 Tax=Luteibacter sp. 329MFSha TaxID=1798239 RepID=UPI0011141ADF|nr:hypothetical protein [Luteibacter sp. 329MFSha]